MVIMESNNAAFTASATTARPMKPPSPQSIGKRRSLIVSKVPGRGTTKIQTRRTRSCSPYINVSNANKMTDYEAVTNGGRSQQQQQHQEAEIISNRLQKLEKQIDVIVSEMDDTEYDINEEIQYKHKLHYIKRQKQNKLLQANRMYGVGVVPGIGLASPLERVIRSIEHNIAMSEHRLEAYEDRLESLKIELAYKQNKHAELIKRLPSTSKTNHELTQHRSRE